MDEARHQRGHRARACGRLAAVDHDDDVDHNDVNHDNNNDDKASDDNDVDDPLSDYNQRPSADNQSSASLMMFRVSRDFDDAAWVVRA